MHTLAANLKHLYQKRIVFLWHFIFVTFAAVIIFAIEKRTDYALSFLWVWVYLVAVIPTTLTVETLILPLSFCLPGHKRIPQKVAFILAPAIGFFWTIVFIFTPSFNLSALSFLALFSLLATTYLVSAWIIFRLGSQFVNVAFGLIAVLFLLDFLVDDLTAVPLCLITHYPLSIIVGNAALAALLWRRMADESIVRRYHQTACTAAPSYDLFVNTPVKVTEDKNTVISRAGRSIEISLLGRISRSPVNSVSKYIWGALYAKPVVRLQDNLNWKNILFVLIPSFIYCGYLSGNTGNQWWFFFVWVIVIGGIRNFPVTQYIFSPLLFFGGRRERFYASLFWIITVCVCYSVVILLLSPFTLILEYILPPITFLFDETIHFKAMSPLFSIFPWLLFPLSEGVYLFLSQKFEIVWRGGTTSSFLRRRDGAWWWASCHFLMIATFLSIREEPSFGPALLVSAVLISWAFFVRVLWTTTRDDCLV